MKDYNAMRIEAAAKAIGVHIFGKGSEPSYGAAKAAIEAADSVLPDNAAPVPAEELKDQIAHLLKVMFTGEAWQTYVNASTGIMQLIKQAQKAQPPAAPINQTPDGE